MLLHIFHNITSCSVHDKITNIAVLYDYICSDHKRLSVTLKCKSGRALDTEDNSADRLICSSQWAFASPAELYSYVSVLNNNLSEINIPECLFEYLTVMI